MIGDNYYKNMVCSSDFMNIYLDCISYYLKVLYYGVTFGVLSFTFIYIIVPICGAIMVLIIGGIIYDMINLFKNINTFVKYLFVYCRQNYRMTFNIIVFIFTINIINQIINHFFIEDSC
tara:strand:+ start:92 stop:448 length:357 start_codon:yes stop_codon:yes gene_type:complete